MEAEKVNGGTQKVLDSVDKSNKSKEQRLYVSLLENMINQSQANKTFEPKHDIKTEFTVPIADLKYLSEEVWNQKRFTEGFKKHLDHDIKLGLLRDYLPRMQQQWINMSTKLVQNVMGLSNMVLLHHR